MKRAFSTFLFAMLLTACVTAPDNPSPTGDWTPVNKVAVSQRG